MSDGKTTTDDTATRDSGGAYGGEGGTMPDAATRRNLERDRRVRGESRTPPPQQNQDTAHPGEPTGAGRPPYKDQSHLGDNWTGETEPDREYLENTPTRGGLNDAPANDAY